MATFNGRTFSERGRQSGRFNPQEPAGVEYVIQKIPGGSSNVIQTAGRKASIIEIPAQMDDTNLSNLYTDANAGTSATLDYSWGSFTASLVEIRDAVEITPNDNYYQATLVFVRL